MDRHTLKLGAAIAVAALLGAACGADSNDDNARDRAAQETTVPSGGSTSTAPMDAAVSGGVASGASELRAGLTSLLQEHVYLAGAAISTAVQAGGDMEAPAVKSAVATLDANSVALSDAIGSVYGDGAGKQFLALWRKHIGFFVDYTLGGATGDSAKQQAAKQALDDYRKDFGAFVASATDGELDAKTVEGDLQMHVDTLVAAIDAVLAKSPDVFPKLRTAAQHMPGTANALATAIAAQYPDKFSG